MQDKQITLEQLPAYVAELSRKVDDLTYFLKTHHEAKSGTGNNEEKPLTVSQAADFLGIAPQTVYQRIKDIPHKKRFGRLYFFRSQLAGYLNAGEGVANG